MHGIDAAGEARSSTARVVASGLNAGQRHVAFGEIECGLVELTGATLETDSDDAWMPSAVYAAAAAARRRRRRRRTTA